MDQVFISLWAGSLKKGGPVTCTDFGKMGFGDMSGKQRAKLEVDLNGRSPRALIGYFTLTPGKKNNNIPMASRADMQ